MPAAKAASALIFGASTSAISFNSATSNFFPHSLEAWLAACASALAIIYTLCLLTEWFWKRLWRPVFTALGWAKPVPHHRVIVVEEGGEIPAGLEAVADVLRGHAP